MKHIVLLLLSVSLFGKDIDDIKNMIYKTWKLTSQKKDGGFIHPNGSWMATSEGSFWDLQTPDENRIRIESASNTLNFEPYHINIEIHGAKKDIAYVTYYLGGTIEKNGKILVPNYRTRASNLLKKEKDNWFIVGQHYSPMHSGSGVKFD